MLKVWPRLVLLSLPAVCSLQIFAQSTTCYSNSKAMIDPMPLVATVSGGPQNIDTAKVLAGMGGAYRDFTVVTAHRGDWYACPENTLGALQQAINEGMEAIEFDSRFTIDKGLLGSHDNDLIKETVNTLSSPWVMGNTLAAIQSLKVRDRRGYPQPTPNQMSSLAQVYALWTATNTAGRGPVLVVDLKDRGSVAWQSYLDAVQLLDTANVPVEIRRAIIFKLPSRQLPSTVTGTATGATIESECSAHPGWGHIIAIMQSQQATDPNYGPTRPVFQEMARMSNPNTGVGCNSDGSGQVSDQFIQQIELNLKTPAQPTPSTYVDPVSLYIPYVRGFGIFSQTSFYPEGVSTIWNTNKQGKTNPQQPNPSPLESQQTFCCQQGDLTYSQASNSEQDLRAIPAFPFYFERGNNLTVGGVTTDNLFMTLSFLKSVGRRNLAEITP